MRAAQLACVLRPRGIRLTCEDVDSPVYVCVRARVGVRPRTICLPRLGVRQCVGRGRGRVELGEVALEEVLVPEGARTVRVRADEVAPPLVRDGVVRCEGFFLRVRWGVEGMIVSVLPRVRPGREEEMYGPT